ncbi:MAG: calcium-binding protein, partial [Reyranellaceae bacterium]
MPYTFVNNGGSSSSVSTTTLGAGTINLTRYDESGIATDDFINVAGYTVNNVTIANGTGANDSVVGSSGNDLFVWDDFTLDSGARATVNGSSRYGWNRGSNNAHIEDWFGGAGNDIFNFTSVSGGTALARATTIHGGTGNDVVWEDSGNDTVYGDEDSDTVYGGTGNDVLAGDSSLSQTTSGTSDGADILYGGSGNDRIYGNGGDDVGYGGDGTDTLYGGDGNDVLQGDAGNDSLFGGAGDDLLDGGAGADALFGGSGTDYATYASA